MRETDSYKWEKIVYRKEQRLQTRLDVEIQKQLKRFRLDVKLQAGGGYFRAVWLWKKHDVKIHRRDRDTG